MFPLFFAFFLVLFAICGEKYLDYPSERTRYRRY